MGSCNLNSCGDTLDNGLTSLKNLTLAKYRFQLRADTCIKLPFNKYSAFHGGFGHALKRISPHFYDRLCSPRPPDGGNGAWPKSYVLLPPLDHDTQYLPGREFFCELTLFGNTVPDFPVCYAALEFLGSTFGLGKNRGKFTITQVDAAMPAAARGDPAKQDIIDGEAIAEGFDLPDSSKVSISFVTHMRLKTKGRLLRDEPEFSLFFARLLGRLNTLALAYGNGPITTPEQKHLLLQLAALIKIKNADICWNDWSRFSSRQKAWMKFGGLTGQITYIGNMGPFLPWLAMGEWTQAGGKTSFGLGKYVIRKDA